MSDGENAVGRTEQQAGDGETDSEFVCFSAVRDNGAHRVRIGSSMSEPWGIGRCQSSSAAADR
jgi:hypothetical protein